jgi:hypothetical protein
MNISVYNLSAVALIAILLFSAPGCSDNNSPVSTELCIEFDSAQAPAPGTVTVRLSDDSVCEEVVVEIVVTDVDDVFGLRTVIEYDPDVAYYNDEWSALNSILGADLLVNIEEDPVGTLTVGVTRVATTGVDITGTEVLIELFLQRWAIDADSGPLTIEDGCLLDSGDPNANPPVGPDTIPGVTCSGGTLAVR